VLSSLLSTSLLLLLLPTLQLTLSPKGTANNPSKSPSLTSPKRNTSTPSLGRQTRVRSHPPLPLTPLPALLTTSLNSNSHPYRLRHFRRCRRRHRQLRRPPYPRLFVPFLPLFSVFCLSPHADLFSFRSLSFLHIISPPSPDFHGASSHSPPTCSIFFLPFPLFSPILRDATQLQIPCRHSFPSYFLGTYRRAS
jgi:hypothetical protein